MGKGKAGVHEPRGTPKKSEGPEKATTEGASWPLQCSRCSLSPIGIQPETPWRLSGLKRMLTEVACPGCAPLCREGNLSVESAR